MLLIIGISTFVCISLGLMGVYWLVYRPQSAATERLRRLGGNQNPNAPQSALSVEATDDNPITQIAERLASPLSKIAPPSATEAKKLQKQLMHAGFRAESAPMIYRGI